MPESFRLLSELESAEIAEVSVETIRKYRDCGLLDPVVKDNQTFFQEVDIRALFFTKKDKSSEPKAVEGRSVEQVSETGNSDNWTINNPNFFSAQTQRAEFNEVLGQPNSSTTMDSSRGVTVLAKEAQTTSLHTQALTSGASSVLAEDKLPAQELTESGKPAPSGTASTATTASEPPDFGANLTGTTYQFDTENEVRSEPFSASVSEAVQTPISAIQFEKSPEHPRRSEAGTSELIDMNESLRDQIQLLREERDWLRERIEKLEARSEREQMLLLSESENLRNMIGYNKKSFWQKALPWFMGTSDRKD